MLGGRLEGEELSLLFYGLGRFWGLLNCQGFGRFAWRSLWWLERDTEINADNSDSVNSP